MKIVTIISGVALTLTGIYCIARQGTPFLAMAFVLGLVMLLHGILSIVSCVTEKRHGYASGYVLADGFISLILSAVVLMNQLVVEAAVPIFFGMWLLFSGMMHAMQALVVQSAGERGWRISMAFAALSMLAGVSAFIHTITAGMAVLLLLGIFFVAQGISVTVLGLHFKNKRKRRAEKQLDKTDSEKEKKKQKQ